MTIQPKPFQLHSGNNLLNAEYYSLCHRIIYQSGYEPAQNERVAEIRALLNKYQNHKEIIVEGLRNELSTHANKYRNIISKAKNKLHFGMSQASINAVENLLNWFNTGMLSFVFIPLERKEPKLSEHFKPTKAEIKKFEKLSYIKKLNYWSNNNLEHYISTYLLDAENGISILPEKGNIEQYQQYYEWYKMNLTNFEPLKYDIDLLKSQFIKATSNNPNANEVRLKELKEYNDKKEKYLTREADKRFNAVTYVIYKAFSEGYYSVIYQRNINLEHEFITSYGAINSLIEGIIIAEMITFLSNPNIQNTTTKPEPQKPVKVLFKPQFKTEIIDTVFDIIKDYFEAEQQSDLKQLLSTGNNASQKLLFKDNGNRLSDTLKQLIESYFITPYSKQDLIEWVVSNFQFYYRGEVRNYSFDTVEKTISRNNNPCKNPIIKIEKGQIIKVEQARKRKQSKK
jgi:hypothetical protein